MDWSPASWRNFEARQQPPYPDPGALEAAARELCAYPPLVSLTETEALKTALANAQAGRGFLLQGGDCAESFAEFSAEAIASSVDVIARMAETISAASGLPVVRVGRIAGQFAKPRTAETEVREGVALPAYRGDMVNGLPFAAAARRADPERLFRAWGQSAATLSHVRRAAEAARAPVWTSHEALLLAYEESLVRTDPASRRAWGSSGHFLWIGHRTRFLGSAHIEFARGLANPIGIKCGPPLEPDTLLRLLEALDPEGEPGRITLISRMGRGKIARCLPPLLRAVRDSRRPVLWVCDPMHGNTTEAGGGRKTRRLDDICAEIQAFFALATDAGVHPGGLHIEMTGRDVLECTGGAALAATAPGARYDSHCDPRLNAGQAMEVAAVAGSLLTWSVPAQPAPPPLVDAANGHGAMT